RPESSPSAWERTRVATSLPRYSLLQPPRQTPRAATRPCTARPACRDGPHPPPRPAKPGTGRPPPQKKPAGHEPAIACRKPVLLAKPHLSGSSPEPAIPVLCLWTPQQDVRRREKKRRS